MLGLVIYIYKTFLFGAKRCFIAKWPFLIWTNPTINWCFFQDSNIGIPDVDGKTPLHWAASSKDPEAVECVKRILVSKPFPLKKRTFRSKLKWRSNMSKLVRDLFHIIEERKTDTQIIYCFSSLNNVCSWYLQTILSVGDITKCNKLAGIWR